MGEGRDTVGNTVEDKAYSERLLKNKCTENNNKADPVKQRAH